ncbi:MAG: hypothetical protein ACREGH_04050 [Minisyncoccia bacterium]
MQGIGGLLERYKNFSTPPLAAARAVSRAILGVVGITVAEKAIAVKNGVASVSGNGVEKAEILLNKKVILDRVAQEVGGAVRDLR